MKRIFLPLAIVLCGCSKSNDPAPTEKQVLALPKMENISLNYHPSEQQISLARDVQSEGATVTLKDKAYWITKLTLNKSTITFNVLENTETESGHRFDTILISHKGIRIGSICVSQARKNISPTRLIWASPSATYLNKAISTQGMSGQEITKAIYNLSKTTNGKDSYKNYPAFAFCIEMNHDPENNMEWYLPTKEEVRKHSIAQSYNGTPLQQHNYWWTSSENTLNGNAYSVYSQSIASRGAENKSTDWWVIAFRNGKME